jgi:hypothetical protein
MPNTNNTAAFDEATANPKRLNTKIIEPNIRE